MKKLLIIAAMAATAVACAPKTAPELPMETFFRNSEKSDYQISPDGKYFSYMPIPFLCPIVNCQKPVCSPSFFPVDSSTK